MSGKPSKMPKAKKLFDGIAPDHELDQLLGKKRAKKTTALGLRPEKWRRYRRWEEQDILWILKTCEELPRGYQATFLKRLGVKTNNLYYWRRKFIERQSVVDAPALGEPSLLKPDTSHAKDHEFGISDQFRRELDADYDKD